MTERLPYLDRVWICAAKPKQRDCKHTHCKHAGKPTLDNFWMITAGNRYTVHITILIWHQLHYMYIIPRIYQLKTYYNHVMALLDLSGMTRVSRYQKGKTRKVKPIWISGARDNEWQWHLLGHMQCLLPSTSSKVSPCGRHMGSPPTVHTRRVPPCMAQSRLRAFPR